MVDRIKKVMDYYQLSSTNFADTIDINRSSLTHIFSGRNQPSLDVAKKILKAFPEVNTEWLVMGVGPMLKNETTPETPVTIVDNMSQTDLFGNYESETAPQIIEVTAPAPEEASDIAEQPFESQEDTSVRKPTPATRSRRNTDSSISARESKRERIFNSQDDKKIVKIVFFYDDHSFEEYRPKR